MLARLHRERGVGFKGKKRACISNLVSLNREGARAGSNGKERSISAMMCEKGKLLAQHGLPLITSHWAVLRLRQNKQVEM